jgi:hypothetical protein
MNKIVLMIVLLSSVDVFAESISTIPWSALELSEQEILRKAESDWDNYPPARQQKLLNGARKWGALSPENRQLMRRNQQYLKRLNPQRRQRLLNRMKRFRALPDVEKIRLRDTFRKFKRLPVQKRRQLREQWKKKSPAERRKFRRESIQRNRSKSRNGASNGAAGERQRIIHNRRKQRADGGRKAHREYRRN